MQYRQRGISLIEMIIAMTIFAIMLTQVGPGLANYYRDKTIRAVTNDIHNGLRLAKSEAIKRNNTVLFIPSKTTWRIEAVPEGGGSNVLVTQRYAGGMEEKLIVNYSDTSVSFNGLGRANLAGTFTADITKPSSSGCRADGGKVRCLQVNVTPSGMIKICDKALPTSDPKAC